MTRDRSDRREQGRAVVLAAVMVLSVMGGTVAFAGTASAAVTGISNGDATNVEIGDAGTDVQQTVTFQVTTDGAAAEETVTLDVSNAPSDVSLGTASITGTQDNVGSADYGTLDQGTVDITLSGQDTGNTHTVEVEATLSHDTSVVNSESTVQYTVSGGGDLNIDSTFEDTVAPGVSNVNVVGSDGNDVVTEGDDVDISATVTDAGSGVDTVTADATSLTGASDVTLTQESGDTYTGTVTVGTVDADGEKTITVTATDNAGNSGDSSGDSNTDTVYVDTTAPSDLSIDSTATAQSDATIDLSASYTEVNPNTVSVAFQNDSAGTVATFTGIDDSDYGGNNGEQTVSIDLSSPDTTNAGGLADGNTYDAVLTATDLAGLSTDSSVQADVLTVDDTPPSISGATATDTTDGDATPEDDLINGGETVTVSAEVTDANGPASVQAETTGESELFTGGTPFDLTDGNDDNVYDAELTVKSTADLPADGTYTVDVTATDTAGNSQTVETNELTVDTTGAGGGDGGSAELATPSGDVYKQSGDTLQVGYQYTEDFPDLTQVQLVGQNTETTYAYNIEDSDYEDDGTTKTVTLDLDSVTEGQLADGHYRIDLVVTDSAGNTETISGADDGDPTVFVDDTAPAVNVDGQPENTGPEGSVTVDYTVDETTDATVSFDLFNGSASLDVGQTQTVEPDAADSQADKSVTIDLSNFDLADNTDYSVEVTATEDNYDRMTSDTSDSFTVNAGAPEIESVEAEAGRDTVTVTFSEPVTSAADGSEASLAATDLAYEDPNGQNAISSVDHDAGSATATVTLDSAVQAADLGTDEISARSESVYDLTGNEMATTQGEFLQDTIPPAEPSVDEPTPINTETVGDYAVPVALGDEGESEQGSVEVTLTDGETTVTNTVDVETDAGSTSVPVDADALDTSVEALAQGEVTVTATITDEADQSNTSESVTVTKDTVRPTVENVQANAGTTTVTVTMSEAMADPNGATGPFTFSAGDVSDVEQTASDTIELTTDTPVQAADIGSATITVDGAADVNGSTAQNTQGTLTDTVAPETTGISAVNGSATVTIETTEFVYNATAEGEGLTASDFTYTDANDGGATNIESVEFGDTNAEIILTLDAPVNATDLGNDTITVNAEAVDDAGDNFLAETTLTVQDNLVELDGIELTTEGSTGTVTVTASEELDELSVLWTTQNELAVDDYDETAFEDDDSGPSASLDLSDFESTEVEGGYEYTATFEAPRDGAYVASILSAADIAGNEIDYQEVPEFGVTTDTATVDTGAPTIVDAYISGYDGDETDVTVRFNESVDISGLTGADVSVESVPDADPVALDGDFVDDGEITLVFEGQVPTGSSPDLTIEPDAVTERYDADESVVSDGEPETIHTQRIDLNEGVNFVSVPAAAGTLDVDAVNTSNVDTIWTYDAESESWQSYDPAKPDGESDFDKLRGGQGYVFVMEAPDSLRVNVDNVVGGESVDSDGATPAARDLQEGWNLVGHWQEGAQRTQVALSSVGRDSVFRVYGQAEGTTEFRYQSRPFVMEPGQAYWVFVQDDEVYTEAPMRFEEPPIFEEPSIRLEE